MLNFGELGYMAKCVHEAYYKWYDACHACSWKILKIQFLRLHLDVLFLFIISGQAA